MITSEAHWSWEICRRILARAVLCAIRNDVLQVVGPLQLCAGQPAGCEVAIHAML